MSSFKRVLIANRGEIAIRIAKAAASLGIETVGIYSHDDAQNLHTRQVDIALALDGEDAVSPYLDINQIVQLAADHGCDCVHPGYGFLSENAQFAAALAERDIQFIGPSATALGLFGDKVAAKRLAQSIDIPTISGRNLESAADAAQAASELGYPIMLKAAAGGGGRGMRAVADPADLEEAFSRCQSEAESAFGDGSLFIEKLIEQPRHIEVQVLVDRTEQAIHLRERDCSIQQRHQKVVEIAPAPNRVSYTRLWYFIFRL